MMTIANPHTTAAVTRRWPVSPAATRADPNAMPAQAAHPLAHARALGQLLASMTQANVTPDDPAGADACLAMFVNSRLATADLRQDAGQVDAAAQDLAETHQTLMALIDQSPHRSTWHQTAVWHSRRTHCALLNHVQEHGGHPAIDAAFRAGCLTMHVPGVQLH
jgi:hypothetical protein